jgi:arylsulfatase
VSEAPSVILISVDSLRADHLGCHGYRYPTSPRMDRLAAEGALCERVYCPAIPTQPSHTTLYTGQHALTHGVVAHGGKATLSRSAPFLPEIFLQNGYSTCAVDTLIRERIWFARGYEHVIDPSIRHVFYASVTAEELNDCAIRWMRTVPAGPFFLFVHYWDVHYPYVPPEDHNVGFYEGNPTDPDNHALDPWWSHPIGAMARDTWLRTSSGERITDPDYVRALYDREIRYLDEGIRHLLEALEDLDRSENTIVVLLSDHGESMTEHRIFFDHYGLYDSTLRIPLIWRWPGRIPPGLRIPEMLQMTDVAPTLLEAAGLPVPAAMEGRSFFPELAGGEKHGGYERVYGLESTWQAKWSLRTADLKLVVSRLPDLLGNPPLELYDLARDPLEKRNLVEDQPRLASELQSDLEGWIGDRMRALGLKEDPVRVEGASMRSTWQQHLA